MVNLLLRVPLFVSLIAFGALAMSVPAIHAAIAGDRDVARSFAFSGLLFLVIYALLAVALRDSRSNRPSRGHLMALVGAYTVLPAMFAVPFHEAVGTTRFLTAWFEMVSSFTTTGATMYAPDRLPPSVHLWRALVGWLGGFLILVSAFGLFAPMNLGGFEVISAERAGEGATATPQITRIADGGERMLRFARMLAPIYGGLTGILWIGLSIAGSPPLAGLCHAMSTLATSGISPVAGPQGGIGEEVLIFGFLIFAMSRRLMTPATFGLPGRRERRNREVIVAAVCILATTVLLFLRHWVGAFEVDDQANWIAGLSTLWGAMFTAASFLTTTGFESTAWVSVKSWSGLESSGFVLLGLALFGGGVATTAGGVKLLRIYALYAHGRREMERLIHPSSIGGSGALDRRIRRKGAEVAWIFFMLMAISIAVVMAALALFGVDFEPAMVLTLAALTTTGPLAQAAATTPLSYADLGDGPRVLLALAMVVGRLETLAFIALLNPDFWRR